jgi:acyl-CoA thioester hydrolase
MKNRHVNNIVYLNWAQYISGEHWKKVATKQMLQEYAWVVSRNEIDYLKQLKLNDQVCITTWIEKCEKATTIRVIEIYNKQKIELAAKAIIVWYALNPKTQKPLRIAEDLKKLFGV